jgi:hypothetical protein
VTNSVPSFTNDCRCGGIIHHRLRKIPNITRTKAAGPVHSNRWRRVVDPANGIATIQAHTPRRGRRQDASLHRQPAQASIRLAKRLHHSPQRLPHYPNNIRTTFAGPLHPCQKLWVIQSYTVRLPHLLSGTKSSEFSIQSAKYGLVAPLRINMRRKGPLKLNSRFPKPSAT